MKRIRRALARKHPLPLAWTGESSEIREVTRRTPSEVSESEPTRIMSATQSAQLIHAARGAETSALSPNWWEGTASPPAPLTPTHLLMADHAVHAVETEDLAPTPRVQRRHIYWMVAMVLGVVGARGVVMLAQGPAAAGAQPSTMPSATAKPAEKDADDAPTLARDEPRTSAPRYPGPDLRGASLAEPRAPVPGFVPASPRPHAARLPAPPPAPAPRPARTASAPVAVTAPSNSATRPPSDVAKAEEFARQQLEAADR